MLVLLPSAAACTLAEEPPDPARFVVWNPDTDERHVIDVTGRELGAECGLANDFAYDGRHFAWLSADGSLRPKLHLRDLHTGQEWSEQLPESHSADIILGGDRIYVVWLPEETADAPAGSAAIVLVALGVAAWRRRPGAGRVMLDAAGSP
jgi:hypothetical protein